MQENVEDKQRIKTWMAACMLAVAGSIDLIQALLTLVAIGVVMSPIISVGATALFAIWCWMMGVSFVSSPKKLAAMAGQAIIGLIPAADALPELTVGMLIIIIITRSEDKGGIIGKATSVATKVKQPMRGIARKPVEV